MTSRNLAELAALCGAEIDGDRHREIDGPSSLAEAGPRDISFLANRRYADQLATTRAGAVVVARETERPNERIALLRCDDPNRAFTAIVRAFAPPEPRVEPGIHPSAVVEAGAEIDPSATIGPLCWVASGARIGPRTRLVAQVAIGPGASVGADCTLHPHVVLYPRVTLGSRCLIHGGVVIGSDGFGFEPTRTGWEKVPQCGTVIVGDDVELGANVAVDRGRFGATRVGNAVKMDNLVHVAHNVVVGDAALLVAQTGVAGSTRIGKRAILAGQSGIGGHVSIGDGARVGAQSGVAHDVPAGSDVFGTPARPIQESLRSSALVNRLPDFIDRLRALERRLAELESRSRAPEEEK